jgi:hypothetical protein
MAWPCFVVGRQFFFFVVHDLALALWANGYALKRFGNIVLGNLGVVVAGGNNG